MAYTRATKYPTLAKEASDGIYCYIVQRRISSYVSAFCVKKGISANTATLIDFIFAVLASLFLALGYPITSVLFIQMFGIWSCVDGEISRAAKQGSKLGDFYDTMVDRSAEYLFVGALMLWMNQTSLEYSWGPVFFAYMGSVFIITASSEKFRSVFHSNYPKAEQERLFCWFCAGSDTRFFFFSLGIIAYGVSDNASIIYWLLVLQAMFLNVNFAFRMWKIYKLKQCEEDKTEQTSHV
jgi:phosphatidylglycerophosphate synthase